MVWRTSRLLTVSTLAVRLVRALLPVATLFVGKLIIDEVVQLSHLTARPAGLGAWLGSGLLGRLEGLLLVEFALAVVSDLLGRFVSLVDGLLSDRVSNDASVRLMEHAATLDLADFEDAAFQDRMDRARMQASGRMSLMSQLFGQTRARIATNHELSSVASVDPLTGLLNRLGLRRAVEDRFGATAPSSSLVGVHCLDLDGFKAVNDRFGHAAGDAVLVEIARRILECTRDGDVAARFGGDEFVLLQTGIAHRDEVELFARRVCRAVTASLVLDGTSLSVGVSIGSCTGEIAREPFDDLLAVADRRMYAAKQDGGGVHAAALAG